MISDDITLKVQNNLSYQANVPILGGVQDPTNGQVNSNTLYEWDLSTETFVGITKISLTVSTITNPNPQVYSQAVGGINSVEQVVNVLNSFNVGLFNFSGTTIWITNSINIYGDLSLTKDPEFKITIDTTQAGSASDTFVLPLASGETYNFDIDWGDGSSQTITSDTDVTHVYPSSGIYQISITGAFPRIFFNNMGDRLKLISIDNWGDIVWSSMVGAFWGCSNMNGTYTDAPNLNNVTNMFAMFFACTSFNHTVNFDTSNVIGMSSMFALCTSFNQPINSFNTSNVITMSNMFQNCTSFKQSLATFDMENVSNVNNMLLNCDINNVGTATNYDDTLIAWASQNLVNNLNFNAGISKYSAIGLVARNNIIANYNWTITDGGLI